MIPTNYSIIWCVCPAAVFDIFPYCNLWRRLVPILVSKIECSSNKIITIISHKISYNILRPSWWFVDVLCVLLIFWKKKRRLAEKRLNFWKELISENLAKHVSSDFKQMNDFLMSQKTSLDFLNYYIYFLRKTIFY